MKNLSQSSIRQNLAWILGFSSTLYIPLAGGVKLVDLTLLLSIIVFSIKPRKPPLEAYPLVFCIVVIIITTLIQTILSGQAQPQLLNSALGAAAAAFGFLIVSSYRLEELDRFLKGLLSCLALLALLVIVGVDFPSTNYESRYGSYTSGFMPDPNRFAFTLSCGICLTLTNRSLLPRRGNLLFCVALSAILFIALLKTGSRSGLIFSAVLLGTTLIIKNFYFKRVKLTIRGFLLLLSTAFLLIFSAPKFLSIWQKLDFDIFTKFQEKTFSYFEDSRYEKLLSGLKAFQSQPIFGHGLDGFSLTAGAGTSHNSYVEILVNGGSVSFILFIAFFLWTLFNNVKFIRLERRNSSNAHAQLALLLLCIFFMGTLNIHFLAFAYLIFGVISNRNSLSTSHHKSQHSRTSGHSGALTQTLARKA